MYTIFESAYLPLIQNWQDKCIAGIWEIFEIFMEQYLFSKESCMTCTIHLAWHEKFNLQKLYRTVLNNLQQLLRTAKEILKINLQLTTIICILGGKGGEANVVSWRGEGVTVVSCRLVHHSYSMLKGQAPKMVFFAPCQIQQNYSGQFLPCHLQLRCSVADKWYWTDYDSL